LATPKLPTTESPVLSQDSSNSRHPSVKTSALMRLENVCCCFKAHYSNTETPFYWEQRYKASLCLDARSNMDLTIQI